MKRMMYILAAVACLVLLASCSAKKPPPPKPQWLYESDAISLRFRADQVLNMFEGSPHTLMVCVYQLRDDNMLNQLATSEDGIYQLLDCEQFDSSIGGAKRLIIHPDQDLTFVMDRLAGTRKVAFVAGYSQLTKERIIRIVDIPVYVSEDQKTATARKLKLVVNLGSEQIAAIQSY